MSFTFDVRLRRRRLPLTAAGGRPSLACGRHRKRKRIALVAGKWYVAMGAGAGAACGAHHVKPSVADVDSPPLCWW